jgi:hypothetical protein
VNEVFLKKNSENAEFLKKNYMNAEILLKFCDSRISEKKLYECRNSAKIL